MYKFNDNKNNKIKNVIFYNQCYSTFFKFTFIYVL